MKRAPSPPNHHSSFSPSPLSSPLLSSSSSFSSHSNSHPPSPPSGQSSYFEPSYHQPTVSHSHDDRPPAPDRRRSSSGSGFPRSQPLRPMLGLTSLVGAASEKPQLIPINGMKAGPGKGKVKMLVGRTMKVRNLSSFLSIALSRRVSPFRKVRRREACPNNQSFTGGLTAFFSLSWVGLYSRPLNSTSAAEKYLEQSEGGRCRRRSIPRSRSFGFECFFLYRPLSLLPLSLLA